MLATSPSKTSQHVIGRVVSSGLGQGSYWSAHGLISNRYKTHGNVFNTQWIMLVVNTLRGQKSIYLEIEQKINVQ